MGTVKEIMPAFVRTSVHFGVVFVLVFSLLSTLITPVSAAQITDRKVTLSSSAGAATGVSYTFQSAALPTATPVRSVALEACTTASGACTGPTGFSASSSTLASQPSGLGTATAWTVSTAVAGSLRINHASNAVAPSGAVTIQWNGVVNPTAQNTTFFLRATTYSDTTWTTAIDTGVVAVSTAQQITVSASVAETLSFCTGTSGITNTSCSGATGSAVSLGNLTSSATGSGTSQIGVGTNANTGYAVTVNGSTLTSGSNTITALATQAASATGSEQFGINLRDNATPNVGANPDGAGDGTYTANYGTVDQYRFVSGDSIASNASSDDFKLFTVSYVANIATATEAGTYSSTFTYICTATF
jgi:hypothetical protein